MPPQNPDTSVQRRSKSLRASPVDPTASPPPAPKPTPPVSPFRRLLALNLNQVSDLRHERRSPRCRPSQFSLQTIPAFGATGDMLFDSAHLSLGEFLQGVALRDHD